MRQLYTILLACSLLSFYQVQASDKEDLEYNLSTPRATIITHLGALDEENCNYEIAAQPFLHNNRTIDESIKLAIGLRDLLKEKGIQIDLDNIPSDPNYIDRRAKFHKYQLIESLPKVYLVKVHNQWVYSEATVKYIEKFFQRNYLLGKNVSLEWLFKHLYRKVFFEIHVWQFAALLLSLLVSLILYRILNFLLQRYSRSLTSSEGYEVINPLVSPFNIFIICLLFGILIPMLRLPRILESRLLICTRGSLFFIAMLLCYRLADLFSFYIHKRAIEKKTNFNLVLLPMVTVCLKVVVIIVGILITVQSLGFNIRGLIAGVGIGGLGFALASQDTIKNFFGSLVILTDKPFKIGDHIIADKVDGKVEEIGFRSTRIRTDKDSIIYIPNGKLADTCVDNHGEKQYKRFSTEIAIPHTTPAPLIETFIEGLKKIVEHCPAVREGKYYTYLYNLEESSFYIKLEVVFSVTDYNIELANRQEILLQISRLAYMLGIPFGTYILRKHSTFDEETFLANWESDPNSLKEKLQNFFNNSNNNNITP
jgi:MscS family membrane protein